MNMQILIVVLALVATVGVLGRGIVSMMYGGRHDAEHSAQFMSERVWVQGAAVALILLALVLAGG